MGGPSKHISNFILGVRVALAFFF